MKATAEARANIAFVKYWGKADPSLNIPSNSSIGLTLSALKTTTTVHFRPDLKRDILVLDGIERQGKPLERVERHLDRIRRMGGTDLRAEVRSVNSFAEGTGLASSASAFAALTLAALEALGIRRSPREISILARQGSGSAARSVFGGFVEWRSGARSEDSFAEEIFPPSHWDLHCVSLILSNREKRVGSDEGHLWAPTSPLFEARKKAVESILPEVRRSIGDRDLGSLSKLTELDALLMHSVMMTSDPPLFYWLPGTLLALEAVRRWRGEGLPVFFTIDAGPNVHVFVEGRENAREVERRAHLELGLEESAILSSEPGEEARVVPSP